LQKILAFPQFFWLKVRFEGMLFIVRKKYIGKSFNVMEKRVELRHRGYYADNKCKFLKMILGQFITIHIPVAVATERHNNKYGSVQ
jgi:hypothetical protein